ncbi:ATP-dependent DNA helicase [Runella zeae]|uniref:ATP-dependent DNA helicase n=1 Tax=Runella zeae TaxID=94255 RepID=UPI00041646DF|nr:ATP-dependent RecD-like DNA helicase [Runella zeae]
MLNTPSLSLNDQQANIFARITETITNHNSNVNLHILKGSAGTGKTFLTRQFMKFIREQGVNIVQIAPTGKAAKNLALGSMLPAKTIHSAIYKLEQLKNGLGVKFLPKLNQESAFTVYLIDESSMISDKVTASERFQQSGALLCDLVDFVKRGNPKNKFLFVGDPCQLPPVNGNKSESFSPALTLDYMVEKFSFTGNEYFLSEPMRAKGDSYIMDNATYMRDCILSKNQPDNRKLKVNFTGKAWDTACFFERLYDPQNAEKVILIANSNDDVNYWNRAIRKQFGYEQDRLQVGDQVIVNVTWQGNGRTIYNGEMGYVRAIGKTEKYADLHFADVQLEFQGADNKPFVIETKTLLSTLNTERGFKGFLENEAVTHFHAEMHKHTYGKIESSAYYNSIQLRFGYALTCHKAQGSEWDNVIIHRAPLFGEYQVTDLRWRYTALTRARQELYTWAA